MKLSVIGGAGSRSLMLLKSLAHESQQLGIDTLVFMDTDQKRLSVFGPLILECARHLAPGLSVSYTDSAQAAVEGADYLITTIRSGAEASRVTDERIALKHGVLGQETTGAGGFAMALRSIPALIPYCELARKRASPKVMVFNFTNPAGLVTQALRDLGYDFVYGICDAPSGFLRQAAKLYGRPAEDFRAELIGLNHLSYFTSVKLDGRELIPGMLRNPMLYSNTDMRYFEPDLAMHLGCLLNEYLYYFYYREKAVSNILGASMTRGEHIEKINNLMLEALSGLDAKRDFDKMLDIYSDFTHQREAGYMAGESNIKRDEGSTPRFDLFTADEGGYAGVAMALIRASMGVPGGEMSLCLPNRGTVSWLDDTDVIEVSCNLTVCGPVPKKAAYPLPGSAKTLIQTVKYYERTAAKAILERDSSLAADALAAHPLVNSYSLAKLLLHDYLAAYQQYTGGWTI